MLTYLSYITIQQRAWWHFKHIWPVGTWEEKGWDFWKTVMCSPNEPPSPHQEFLCWPFRNISLHLKMKVTFTGNTFSSSPQICEVAACLHACSTLKVDPVFQYKLMEKGKLNQIKNHSVVKLPRDINRIFFHKVAWWIPVKSVVNMIMKTE